MPNHQNQRKKTIFNNGPYVQQKHSDQEDSAFQSSQSYTNSQMMNSQQDNSQSSSFEMFSQMMSQQQGLSQSNEIPPSHRFYTKYMSKAPLFPRESSQSDRNLLPRRRSYQDLQEFNRQRAKDRDDRDLINTFIALVKECADEVKSVADEIKNNVGRSMTESATKSATLMKKINEDLSQHYNTLLDSINEKEAEKDKVAQLEQTLAAKEARIEVLENQLEIAKQTRDERVIESVVDAYTTQQALNRNHLEKLHEEQQKFTKEQVESIQKQQDQMEKSYTVAFSEKQSAKNLDDNPVQFTEPVNIVGKTTITPNIQQPLSSKCDMLQASIALNNATSNQSGMLSTITSLQPAQPLQSSFAHQISTQIASCQPSSGNCGASYNVIEAQRCSNRNYCSNWECQLQNCNTSSIPSRAALSTYNINHSTLFPNSQGQGNNCSQHYNRSTNVCEAPAFPQQLAPTTSTNVSRNIHSNDTAIYSMTSPLQDVWSRANRLRPSPVATVAPQVKDENIPPENISDDIQEIGDLTHISEVQKQQRSSIKLSPARKEATHLQSRRYSARVQARNTPTANQKARVLEPNKQNQHQRQVSSKCNYGKQVPKTQKKSNTIKSKQKNKQVEDVYDFQEECMYDDVLLQDAQTTKRAKMSTKRSQTQLPSNLKSQHVSDYTKTQHMGTGQHESYSSKLPIKTNPKKTHVQVKKQQRTWIIQCDESTEDEFSDDSQCSVISTEEQIQQSNMPFWEQHANKDGVIQPNRKPTISESMVPKASDDFLSTPCLQAQQYDSEDSQLVTDYRTAPGNVVRRKVSRQTERRRRLQAMVGQADSSSTLADITKSISIQRKKLKHSSRMYHYGSKSVLDS